MRANEATALRLRLDKEAFDQAADDKFGSNLPDWKVAELLGTDKTSLSLFRNGRRQPPMSFVAQVLATFPKKKFDDLFGWVADADRVAS